MKSLNDDVTINTDQVTITNKQKDQVTITISNEIGTIANTVYLWPEDFFNAIPVPFKNAL